MTIPQDNIESLNASLSPRAVRLDYHPGKEFTLLPPTISPPPHPTKERNVDLT